MTSDDLLRSAADRQAAKAIGVASLIRKSEEELFALLATRASEGAVSTGPDEDQYRTSFVADDLIRSAAAIEFGRRVFARWSRVLHNFLCECSGVDAQLRDRMLQAIFYKDGGGSAIVAGGLVAAFGLSPAVAAVVAALTIKLVIAPAADEVCETWGRNLGGSG